MKRKPAVAGSFYPGKASELRRMIETMIDPSAKKEKSLAVISPHAGFLYSGPVAGAVFSSVEIPDTVLILGPGHHAIRPQFAVMSRGAWETPLGDVPIDTDLADRIKSLSALVEEDASAHSQEHSLEVELPFIQVLKNSFTFVPICVSYKASFAQIEELASAVAAAIKGLGRDVLMVASTDMSHYVSQIEAKEMDDFAIRKMIDLDPRGLYETVENMGISMCGYKPSTAVIMASKELGATRASLVKYQTSGDRSGDYFQVVGYAGLRIG